MCSASYDKEKTPSPMFYPPRHQGKSHQPMSLWSEPNRTPAAQNNKSNSYQSGGIRNIKIIHGEESTGKALPDIPTTKYIIVMKTIKTRSNRE